MCPRVGVTKVLFVKFTVMDFLKFYKYTLDYFNHVHISQTPQINCVKLDQILTQ